MSSEGESLWPERFLEQDDSVTEELLSVPQHGKEKYPADKVIYINEKQLVFVHRKSIRLYNTDTQRYEHSETFGSWIWHCEQFGRKRIIIKEGYFRIHVWDVSSGKFVCHWDDFPGAGKGSVGLAVPQDGDGDHFLLAYYRNIHHVTVRNGTNGSLKPKVASTQRIAGLNLLSNRDKSEACVHGENVAVLTDNRLIVHSVTTGKLLSPESKVRGDFLTPFLTDKHICLYERVLKYDYFVRARIVVKDKQSMRTVKHSPWTQSLEFKPPSRNSTFTCNDVRFSLQSDVLSANIIFKRNDSYFSVFIISSVDTKQILFKHTSKKLNYRYGYHFTPEIHPNGIVLPVDKHKYKLFRLPRHIINAAIGHSSTVTTPSDKHIIKHAYLSCIQHSSTLDAAIPVITLGRCKASFSEFFHAHRLLMLAVHNGTVAASTDHNGKLWKWFDDIYRAANNFPLESEKQRDALKKILREAETAGVINDGSVTLGDHGVIQELRKTCSAIFEMGKEIFERLVCLEGDHQTLKDSFERYKKVQGMTALLGVALQVIPFVGGSVVAAVSAGAEVFEGLALGEVAKFGFECANNTMLTSQTLEKLLLMYAGEHLSKEQMDNMRPDRRNNLLQHLSQSGTTPEVLRVIFMRAVEGEYVNPEYLTATDLQGRDASIVEVPEEQDKPVSNEDEDTAESNEDDLGTNENEDRDSNEADYEESDPKNYSQEASSSGNSDPKMEGMSTVDMKKLKDFKLDRESEECLDSNKLSAIIAAFMCGYNLALLERFKKLTFAFDDCFQSKVIIGMVISDRDMFPELSVAKEITEFMSEKYDSLLREDVFFEGKLAGFLKKFSKSS